MKTICKKNKYKFSARVVFVIDVNFIETVSLSSESGHVT